MACSRPCKAVHIQRKSLDSTIPSKRTQVGFQYRTIHVSFRQIYFFFDSSASALSLALFSLMPAYLCSALNSLNLVYAASSPFGRSPLFTSLIPCAAPVPGSTRNACLTLETVLSAAALMSSSEESSFLC